MTEGLPDGWAGTRVGDALQVIRGLAFESSAKRMSPEEGYVACLRTANVQRQVAWDDLWYIPASLVRREEQFLKRYDILMSTANSAELVGKVALVRDLPCTSTLGAFITLLRPRQDIDPRFAYYQLSSTTFQQELRRRASTTTNISNISGGKLVELAFRAAPLLEQRRIVDEIEKQFTRLDAAVEGLKRVQAGLKQYRTSVLKSACEGRLVPTEAELARREGRTYETGEHLLKRILVERRTRWEADQLAKMKTSGKAPKREGWKDGYLSPDVFDGEGPYAIPTGWVWTTVDTAGDVLLGRQRAPQYLTGKWPRPYLRVANVKDDRLDLRDIEEMDFNPTHFEKYRLEPGDMLVSEGQSPELVGQSAVYRGGIDGLCFQKTLHRFRAALPGPSVAFMQIVLRSHVKTGLFRKLASITTNIAHLTLEKFKASPFPLPPAAEQARIVAEVDRRLSVVEEVESSIETNLARCARLRQSILKRAFEGKLVAQDPKDEPASVLLNRIREERELPATPRPTAPVLRKATRA